jgi:hypothetical protein
VSLAKAEEVRVYRTGAEMGGLLDREAEREEQGAGSIRRLQTAELSFKRRFNALKGIYEARIEHLTGSIQKTFNTVNSDEVLVAMSEDGTTRGYVPQAVNEIVSQDLRDEREHFISSLANKYSLLEASNRKLKDERSQLVTEANQARLQLGQANAALQNASRDTSTAATLQAGLRAAQDQVHKLRRACAEATDSAASERSRSAADIDRLKRHLRAGEAREAKLADAAAAGERERAEQAREVRELENGRFRAEHERENLEREAAYEKGRVADLSKDLAQERDRAGKYMSRGTELRAELKRISEHAQNVEARAAVAEQELEAMKNKFGVVGEQVGWAGLGWGGVGGWGGRGSANSRIRSLTRSISHSLARSLTRSLARPPAARPPARADGGHAGDGGEGQRGHHQRAQRQAEGHEGQDGGEGQDHQADGEGAPARDQGRDRAARQGEEGRDAADRAQRQAQGGAGHVQVRAGRRRGGSANATERKEVRCPASEAGC